MRVSNHIIPFANSSSSLHAPRACRARAVGWKCASEGIGRDDRAHCWNAGIACKESLRPVVPFPYLCGSEWAGAMHYMHDLRCMCRIHYMDCMHRTCRTRWMPGTWRNATHLTRPACTTCSTHTHTHTHTRNALHTLHWWARWGDHAGRAYGVHSPYAYFMNRQRCTTTYALQVTTLLIHALMHRMCFICHYRAALFM